VPEIIDGDYWGALLDIRIKAHVKKERRSFSFPL
jgi:hypothetical protein